LKELHAGDRDRNGRTPPIGIVRLASDQLTCFECRKRSRERLWFETFLGRERRGRRRASTKQTPEKAHARRSDAVEFVSGAQPTIEFRKCGAQRTGHVERIERFRQNTTLYISIDVTIFKKIRTISS
jgi:hypothetical protein